MQSLVTCGSLSLELECKMVQPLWKSVVVPQEIRNRTITWPSSSTTRHLIEGNKVIMSKWYLNPQGYSSIIHNSQGMETTQVSVDRWIKKMWYTLTHSLTLSHTQTHKYNLAIKKEGNPAICNNTDWPRGNHAKWRKSHRDKYCMISFIVKPINIKNTHTHPK